jgi:hypothetical protein
MALFGDQEEEKNYIFTLTDYFYPYVTCALEMRTLLKVR